MIAPLVLALALADPAPPPIEPAPYAPRWSMGMYVGVAPKLSPLVPISWQLSTHLTPRLALTGEAGVPFYWFFWGLHVQGGATFYVLPPRPGWLSPFVSAKGGGGFVWVICPACGGFAGSLHGLASTTGGLEYVTRYATSTGRHIRLVAEAGTFWLTGDLSRGRRGPLFVGRLGVGVTF